MRYLLNCCVIVTLGLVCTAHVAADLIGPSQYLSFSDSPFSSLGFAFFHLEDFEDGLFNSPGASSPTPDNFIFGPGVQTDSVDADDGVIDGSGANGRSLINGTANPGPKTIRFEFDAAALGAFPTHAGIVWTDGLGLTTFEAFDSGGLSLGTIGPVDISDASINGETAEDRFFGVTHLGGISAITIADSVTGLEVDHLQYGRVPEPSAFFLLGAVVGLIGAARGVLWYRSTKLLSL